jgi:hypothetical protein
VPEGDSLGYSNEWSYYTHGGCDVGLTFFIFGLDKGIGFG